MVTRLETNIQDEHESKDAELFLIKQKLEQILNEHKHCNVTMAQNNDESSINYILPFYTERPSQQSKDKENSENLYGGLAVEQMNVYNQQSKKNLLLKKPTGIKSISVTNLSNSDSKKKNSVSKSP